MAVLIVAGPELTIPSLTFAVVEEYSANRAAVAVVLRAIALYRLSEVIRTYADGVEPKPPKKIRSSVSCVFRQHIYIRIG